MSILEKIRQKDDRQKRIFSFVTALALTLIILVVWISFSKRTDDNLVEEKQVNKLSSVSPVQMIKEEFSKAFSSFNGQTTEYITPMEIAIESENVGSSTATTTEVINEEVN